MENADFLGTGWAFPLRTENGKVLLASGETDVEQAVRIILSTSLGERVMLPTFGSRLQELVFQPLQDNTIGLAQQYVREALDRWEPRIEVDEVLAEAVPENAMLLITIHFHIRDSNVPSNIVYPFYLEQA